jgi:mRNA interferase RelE/StbE
MARAAPQVFSREFDAVMERVPANIGTLILEKIADAGRRLESFPHYRMTGRSECRLRVGDYRVIYDFDSTKNEIYLITLGNRRDVYRLESAQVCCSLLNEHADDGAEEITGDQTLARER